MFVFYGRMYRRSILIVFCIVYAYGNLFAQKSKENLAELQEYAEFYMEDEDYTNALPILKSLDSLDAKNPMHAYQLGICYIKTGRHLKSYSYFEKAEKLKFNDPKLHFYLGQTNQLKHRFDKAILHYQHYLKAIPSTEYEFEKINFETSNFINQCNTGKQFLNIPLAIKIENIGKVVNTPYPEYVPLVSADENTLIFTSRRPETTGGKKDEMDDVYFEDVYICNKQNNNWSTPVGISKKINTNQHDACVGISHNGKTLFLYKPDKKSREVLSGDIYRSDFENNEWTKPVKLNPNINSKYWEPSACISNDDNTIYFSSNRPGGFGGLDIYKSTKENGEWGPAVNLGEHINTPYDEDAPFIHVDNNVLYFSSKGHQNMGGYDIFFSKFNLINQSWELSENIGFPLNSADDDIYFSWNQQANRAYFSSLREDSYGEKDIYRATRISQDSIKIALKGFVLDTISNKPVAASVAFFDVKTKRNIASFNTDTLTGNFSILLEKGKRFLVKIVRQDYLYKEEIIDIDTESALIELRKNFRIKKIIKKKHEVALGANQLKNSPQKLSKREVKKIAKQLKKEDTTSTYQLTTLRTKFKVGDKIIFHNILFDTDNADLNQESIVEVEEIYNVLKSYPELKVEICGHTDSIGLRKHNLDLSKKRAEIVVKYLEKRGLKNNRLTAKGFAEGFPIATNITEKGRHLNRRTEVMVTRINANKIDATVPEFAPKINPPTAPQKMNTLGIKLYFSYNSATLSAYSFQRLHLVIKELNESPSMRIRIHAYSDPLGDHHYNATLSSIRADVIRLHLISKGIDDSRIEIASEGDNKPLLHSLSKKANVLNRRIEFEIISE